MFDQPAAEHGAECASDCGEAGPGANGSAAILLVKGRADDREAPGNEESCARSLDGAGDHQLINVGGKAAPPRSDGEHRDASQEYSAASPQVTNGTADQNERS